MSTVQDALQVAGYGFDIFPARNKRPLITSWKTGTSRESGVIRAWWTQFPDAEIGVPMPEGTVAIDIDDFEAARNSDLEWPPTAWQATRTFGHYQRFHRTDPAREVPQVVGRGGIKLDTRAGGKGYVIAYDPAAFNRDAWTAAPSWVYESAIRLGDAQPPRDPGAPLGTHDDIIRWLGRFVNQTAGVMDEQMLYGVLTAMVRNGRIVSLDPADPWTDADMAAFARDAAKFDVMAPAAPLLVGEAEVKDEGLGGMDAADLLKLDLPDLSFAFHGLMPEGLGVIGAPPKAGKSLLMYQAAVALAMGSDLLGQKGEARPVRYYALEDGKRRSKARIEAILQGRVLPKGMFDLRWTAPKLGGALESEVNDYFVDNPKGVVIVDVLGKVRPSGKSGLNAYDEDYNLLTGIHRVTQKHPGSIVLFVTHDRKAGSEDWMTRITGTRGVTGAADFIIFINRKRGDGNGTVYVTGRDIEDLSINVIFEGFGWRVADPLEWVNETRSETRRTIANWLAEHGPAQPKDIAEGTGLDYENVKKMCQNMLNDDELVNSYKTGYDVARREDAE